MEFKVQERLFIVESTTEIEVIKLPGSNTNRNTAQNLLRGFHLFFNTLY
jgi:hypothetical protein